MIKIACWTPVIGRIPLRYLSGSLNNHHKRRVISGVGWLTMTMEQLVERLVVVPISLVDYPTTTEGSPCDVT